MRVLQLFSFILAISAPAVKAQLPESALSVRGAGGKFAVWWRSSEAPTKWKAASPVIEKALRWRAVRPGLESSAFDISGDRVPWRVQVILVRLDPSLFSIELQSAAKESRPAWSIDSAPEHCALAVNAGQFEIDAPWGWLVRGGSEIQPPGIGPLSSALIIRSGGKAEIADSSEIPDVRLRGNPVVVFQSYPSILTGDGRVPDQLQKPGRGVDLDHRDSRLAIGALRDGRLLLALTRFGGTRLPFGPTTPEMAAIMGALGCRRAMLLDGGLSGQMMFRYPDGRSERWPGLRSVPLGLIAFPKPAKK